MLLNDIGHSICRYADSVRLTAHSHDPYAVLVANLTMPTSLDISGDTAFITTLGGDVLRIENISSLN